jgi:hypothetical protein
MSLRGDDELLDGDVAATTFEAQSWEWKWAASTCSS